MNVPARALPRLHDRRLFIGASIGIIAIVFVGFARSYFLRPLFHRDSLPLLLHVHGLVMFAWFALFFVQTCLIETHRVSLHRKLGIIGVSLAIVMLFLSPYVAFHAAARDVHAHDPAAEFDLAILGYDCVIVALFAGFVACAIAMRRRGDFHKRLMLLATLSLLTPAIGRIVHAPLPSVLAGDVCVLLCVAADSWLHRCLHPALLLGAPLIIAATYLAYVGVGTDAWMHFARALVT
ncbi:MAG: hypothetical protein OJF61_002107 [Rhodanobacteraceae bacterium]|nr:MAG: hypothetical protein OJF61_002107 [Rhodanobacteraceae bacterium]